MSVYSRVGNRVAFFVTGLAYRVEYERRDNS